ncbi:MAG: Ulp1 family isopeptidase [Candidatus Omnitrophica bacterium]|nr:Ulp1 family isopeptidase [Candidatus Omnitrophota bacterium]
MPRDDTIDALLPAAGCACSIARRGRSTCLREETVAMIAARLGIRAEPDDHSRARDGAEKLMRALMRETRCDDEKCVLRVAREMQIIDAVAAGIEEHIAFKSGNGPTDAALFNDSVIHAQLYAWMFQFREFWAYNFNMINYADASLRGGRVMRSPDTLATVNWGDLYAGRVPNPIGMRGTEAREAMLADKRARGVRCSSCVINSDTYDGNGKHWMALFVDARDDSAAPVWSVEFFNSAAIRPESEWLAWMVKTKAELTRVNPRARVEMVCVCKVWHQHSRSECGPYSLFYTWARLNGVPAQYFLENVVPDQIMFEFRQHLFDNSALGVGERFDFERYAKKVRVKWDTESLTAKDSGRKHQ